MEEYHLPLIERREIAEGTMSFHFGTRDTSFSFRAGQYADFTLEDPPETDAEGNTRTFSIASSPNEKNSIMITTRVRPTAFKNSLKRIPLDTKIKVSAAMGSFTLHKDSKRPAVFLAGGIGITPMRSMIAYATEERLPYRLYLFYSNRTPRSTAFLNDFEAWKKDNQNFTFIPTLTEETNASWTYERGVISWGMIKKYLESEGAVYYIAGPQGMVAALWQMLIASGVNEDDVKTEDFAGY